MKVALCFIISYEHILNKEEIWKKWLESNKDIINVYFYYKDLRKITSKWILEHTIPPNCIFNTSYFYVIPAYISIMSYAYNHDNENQWFCLLTDSCCPIISPTRFRNLFFTNYNKSIISWNKAWWNIEYHKRANLALLPENLHLANDPWFVLKRENVEHCIKFCSNKNQIFSKVCRGGLANESLFAIILKINGQLDNLIIENVINSVTHATDWSRMSSSTSPHVFTEPDNDDINFIEKTLENNKHIMFIRKIAPEFPDEILEYYIYEYNKNRDYDIKYNNMLVSKIIRIITNNGYIFSTYLFAFLFPVFFILYIHPFLEKKL